MGFFFDEFIVTSLKLIKKGPQATEALIG
jgi:hypothetical protein